MESKDILNKLYSMVKEMSPTEEYNEVKEKYKKEKEEFLQLIGKQHEIALEDLTTTIYEMDDKLSKQAFVEGFTMAINLMLAVIMKE